MANYIIHNGELYHHGVKGQRWGVRRYQNADGSLTPEGEKRYANASDDKKKAIVLKRKPIDQLSNKELKELNERRRLEKEYARMNPSHIKRGLAIAAGVAAALGTIASLYTNGKNVVSAGKSAWTDGKSAWQKIKTYRSMKNGTPSASV